MGNEYRLAQYVKALLGRNTDASEAMRKLTRLLNQEANKVVEPGEPYGEHRHLGECYTRLADFGSIER